MASLITEEQVNSLVLEVITAVADRERVDPVDLEPPLHEVVDPDALEALCSDVIDGTTRENVVVEFTYCGHQVRVDGGDVSVDTAAIELRTDE